MKNIIFTFFFLLGVNLYSQTNLDISKIEKITFDLHNVEIFNTKGVKREYSVRCQKTSDFQCDYIIKNTKFGDNLHKNNTLINGKSYDSSDDRYDLFSKYTEKKYSMSTLNGEICLSLHNIRIKNDSTINNVLSKLIIDSFKTSKGHYYTMTNNLVMTPSELLRGAFSIRTRTINIDKDYITLDLYCVAIFEVVDF